MTDRMIIPLFRAQSRQNADGQSGKREAGKIAQTAKARKRYAIGIDPGVKTGFAVWDTENRRFLAIETRDFWSVFFGVLRSPIFSASTAMIVIEVAHHAPTYRHLKAEGQNAHTLSKIARNVGQVTREAQLLVEGFRLLGYEVIEQPPLGKKGKAADDRAQFQRLTKWTQQTSQHARDAARMVFGM
jgi:hypothetical protein